MSTSSLQIANMASELVPGPVDYAVLLPPGFGEKKNQPPLPLCLFLHGGMSSHTYLISWQKKLEAWWRDGRLEPMVIAMASTDAMAFYFDLPGGAKWESFIADEFLSHLRRTLPVRDDRGGTVITGPSMGGCGALKIAFARPQGFLAVATVQAAIEPGFTRKQSPGRAQVYIMDGLPGAMMGTDPDLFAANAPAARLQANADAIRQSGLAIYLECGDHDVFNLHDGNEFLHRALWDLDISHEYHLVRNADHIGSSVERRTCEAFGFLSRALRGDEKIIAPADLSDAAKDWVMWSKAGARGPAPDFDPRSAEGVTLFRTRFKRQRNTIRKQDPTIDRRYAVLPPSNSKTV